MPPQTQTVTVTLSPQLKCQLFTERPTAASDEKLLAFKDTCNKSDLKPKEKFKRILSSASLPFLYIPSGDFDIVWNNVLVFALAQALSLYALYETIFNSRLWSSLIIGISFGYIGGLGITAGAHRLWSHRSYKARLPLRIFLMLAQTMAGQNCLYVWCRDHRVHHKFTETDADPHNTNRGFFFA